MAHSDPHTLIALATLIELVFREYSRRGYSLGLNPAQWAALRFFAHAEKSRCTASEFARFHRTTKGTAGHTVAALVRKAYLRRSRSVEDRRVTYLRVTEEGSTVLKRDPMAPIIETIASLSDHEKKVLEDCMERMLRNAP